MININITFLELIKFVFSHAVRKTNVRKTGNYW